MPSVKYIPILAAIALFVGQPAYAQYTTYTNPNGMGGYTITTPGASPYTTYLNPNGVGGYTATTPGASPYTTYINPNGMGGYTTTTPGYIRPYGYR
jgi:hypothetical protein